jgi:hypothetical protein
MAIINFQSSRWPIISCKLQEPSFAVFDNFDLLWLAGPHSQLSGNFHAHVDIAMLHSDIHTAFWSLM